MSDLTETVSDGPTADSGRRTESVPDGPTADSGSRTESIPDAPTADSGSEEWTQRFLNFGFLSVCMAIGAEAAAQRRCYLALQARGLVQVMELGESPARTGVSPITGVLPYPRPQAKPLRAYGACSDHLSRITPRRRSLSGRTK